MDQADDWFNFLKRKIEENYQTKQDKINLSDLIQCRFQARSMRVEGIELDLDLVLAPTRTNLAGLPLRVTALPSAN